MKALRWPVNSVQQKHMSEMKSLNKKSSAVNANENWMAEKLECTRFKWTRQAQWGCRIFDFWCHELGLAVEVDGPEHRLSYDNHRDEYNYRRSAILVLHVRNRDEEDAAAALRLIGESSSWKERREKLGIAGHGQRTRRRLVSGQIEIFQ
jgi:very-short-patch-repair endonuclease